MDWLVVLCIVLSFIVSLIIVFEPIANFCIFVSTFSKEPPKRTRISDVTGELALKLTEELERKESVYMDAEYYDCEIVEQQTLNVK